MITKTDERLTNQPQDITDIGVTEQTTKEKLQQSTEEIRTETENAEKNTEPETTEMSSTTKAEDIPQERRDNHPQKASKYQD